ncbi:MAG TPA: type VI secretion system-associated FHA domain protein TagH, partial [Gammaproteobacteria bacterium]
TGGMETIPEDWDRTEFGYHGNSAVRTPANDDFNNEGPAVVARKSKPEMDKAAVNMPGNNKPRQRAVRGTSGTAAVVTPKAEPRIKAPSTDVMPSGAAGLAAQAVDNDLIAAMGLDRNMFSPEQLAQLNLVVGRFVRYTVEGLLKVLRARSTIKNELRLGVTTVQPRDNNPIKFSVDVDDALQHLFVRQGKGYLPPIASVNESFDTIMDHQVAVLAGMRAAFKSLLHKFDPAELTRRFDTQSGSGIFSGSKKQRYWEAYNEFFNEQVQDLDSSFQHLFGEEFVKAYESQLLELSIARKQAKQDQ